MDSRLLNYYVIFGYKIFFFFFGTIGNILFIHLMIKRKQLQSRTSILQCFQCFFHIFCQIGTLLNGSVDMRNKVTRSDCFDRIAFYIFFQAAQGLIMVIIVADILISVKFPILYRSFSVTKYIFITGTPVLVFSTITTLIAYFSQNDDFVPSCSPPFVFNSGASVAYKYIFIFFSILVLGLYTCLIRIFYQRRQSNNQKSLKTIKRLQLSVVIFILTWFCSQIFGLAILKITEHATWAGMIYAHNVLFLCLSYSNTFYVTMWRCRDYREQFYSVWWRSRSRFATVAVFHVSQPSHKSSNSKETPINRSGKV